MTVDDRQVYIFKCPLCSRTRTVGYVERGGTIKDRKDRYMDIPCIGGCKDEEEEAVMEKIND